MNLIKDLIQQIKQKKESNLKNEYIASTCYVDKSINKLNLYLVRLSKRKGELSQNEIILLILLIKIANHSYENFIHSFGMCKYDYNNPNLEDCNGSIRESFEYMFDKKRKYRNEFEKIYKNFKHIAQRYDNIALNSVLKKMNKAFDFDSSKFRNIVKGRKIS